MRIIVIDDSMMVRLQLKKFFEVELNYEVVALGNDGNDAVALYAEHKPDLITVDLTMPNKDGFEALKEILAIDSEARVIICSAIKDPAKVVSTLEIGAKAYIKKPLQLANKEYLERIKDDIEEALED
ncbi:MAG: response regulator [Lentisphaeraceae bacterium]|nr:response regulator [Lentisphaeraceae bacterium]